MTSPRPRWSFGIHVGEFAENILRAFVHDVGQHVQPAAVGHAQHDFLDALIAGLFDGQVEQRNQAFGPFERKSLGADEALLDEFFEDHGTGQPPENPQLFLAFEDEAVFAPFHAIKQPLADAQVVHVHELHADRPAIGIAQPLDDPPQRQHVRTADRVGRKAAIQIGFRKAVIFHAQLRLRGALHAQRIEIGHHVPPHPVGSHQLVGPVLQQGHFQIVSSGSAVGAGLRRGIEETGRAKRRPCPRRRSVPLTRG